jgi:hypothetical protein
MRKENSMIMMIFLVATVLIVFAYFFLTPQKDIEPPNASTVSPAVVQSPVIEQQAPGSMNPGYGELTPEQISIADIAIGKLLNSSQGITPPMITVKSFEAVDFPNSGLGCPKDGVMYSEVITPGHKVVLEAQGNVYDFRVASAENVVLCEQE